MRARKFRVESICRVLTEQGVAVTGRTYRSWKKAAPSARTVTDAGLTDDLLATVGTPEGMYGRRKMTAHLRRQGHQVAACTVDRLMSDEGPVRGGQRSQTPHHDPRRQPIRLARRHGVFVRRRLVMLCDILGWMSTPAPTCSS